MYAPVPSRRYTRSFKRVFRHKDFRQEKLDRVINLLVSGKKLPPQYRDHELVGEYAGVRECHVQNDLLLLYQIKEKDLILLLIDLGSHFSLFEQ